MPFNYLKPVFSTCGFELSSKELPSDHIAFVLSRVTLCEREVTDNNGGFATDVYQVCYKVRYILENLNS